MQLKIYKLTELAKLEWIHYQTALKRAKNGKYIAVNLDIFQINRTKNITRYLKKSDSEIILAAFNSEAVKNEWSTKKIRKPSQKKR